MPNYIAFSIDNSHLHVVAPEDHLSGKPLLEKPTRKTTTQAAGHDVALRYKLG